MGNQRRKGKNNSDDMRNAAVDGRIEVSLTDRFLSWLSQPSQIPESGRSFVDRVADRLAEQLMNVTQVKTPHMYKE